MNDKTKSEASFSYTYSARQQRELEEIRRKYLPEEPDRMAQIRRMDAGVTRRGTIAAVTLGSVSCLVMGLGMCCSMVWASRWFVPGIVIGLIGIVGMAGAYPLFVHTTQKERKRIAPQILKLTEELIQRQGDD